MKPVVIFSGANDRAVIAFCRYAESVGIAYVIVANGVDDLVFLTKYKDKVISTREKNVLDWETFINNIALAKEKLGTTNLFVLPLTEFINRFLLDNRERIEKEQVSFGLCDAILYATISDKYAFGILCERYGIRVPKEYDSKPTTYPYVIKPKAYFNATHDVNLKPALLYNPDHEQQFMATVNEEEVYYQEYIGGKSIYLLFYFFKDKTYSVYSQENFVQQHNGGSMLFCKSATYHLDQNLVSNYVRLFTENNFHGLVMVEVKYFNGMYYMIEANPRLWGPSQLILDAKMSLFDDFSLDNGLILKPSILSEDYLPSTVYFWSGGLVASQKKGCEVMFYDYEKEEFIRDYSSLVSNEVYLREDTTLIYLKENT